MEVELRVMDRAELIRDGGRRPLEPRAMAVLIRLAREVGRTVRSGDLIAEVLQAGSQHSARRPTRNDELHLYKCISMIRTALDPDRRGALSTLLTTDSGPNPGYRLNLAPDAVDVWRFERLVLDSLDLGPLKAIAQLRDALDLWGQRPLVDVEHQPWARPWIDRLRLLHDQASLRQIRYHRDTAMYGRALGLARSFAAEHPQDPAAHALVAELAALAVPGSGLNRRYATGFEHSEVTVRIGDLLEQDDAHLVIGFGDTFETNIAGNLIVSRRSLNGQLVERFYAGDGRRLGKEIAAALRGVPSTLEPRAAKPHGNRRRYPTGTVAVLNHADRHIFALASSTVRGDNRARSSPDQLREALARLWPVVERHGQRRPVALGVLGAGLARIDDLDVPALIGLSVGSYLAHQSSARTADELRVIVHPKNAGSLDAAAVEKAIARAIASAQCG
jgi:DNA-binding winged helix-turn-helix (wHTH) protein